MYDIPPKKSLAGLVKGAEDIIQCAFNRGVKYGRYLEQQERLNKIPKWTSVAEHLPPTPGKYLVYSKVGTMYTSTFNPDIHKRWPHFGKVSVTHWMSRPEEPKEE